MTDRERQSLAEQVAGLSAQLAAVDRHAEQREAARQAREERLQEWMRRADARLATLEAMRPQAERARREAAAASDVLHEWDGRRAALSSWWARLGIIAGVSGGIGAMVSAVIVVMQATGG